MNATIALSEAKGYLRIDHNEDDAKVQSILDAAESYIRSLCKPYLNESEQWDTLPPELQQAVLILASHWYDNRGIISQGRHLSELPFSVSALVANHRDWPGGTDE